MPCTTPKPTHPFRQYRDKYKQIDDALEVELATHHAKIEPTMRHLSAAERQALQARAQQVFAQHEGLPTPLLYGRDEDEVC